MKQEIKQTNFINKATKTHGNKYDYSKVVYHNPHKKIKIICLEHGEFEQTPDSHIRKHGCPKCNGGTKINLNTFLTKANKKHNNKYNYSKVSFDKTSEKINILCPEHGEFKQTVSDHLFGYGCQKCGLTTRSNSRTKNSEYFISKAIEVHGNFYDYSNVIYEKANRKVNIKCPIHGEFEQTPNDHTSNKNGCPICNESKGEREIRNYLTNNNIDFTPQKRFPDCKDIRTLPFDFYLPDYNICIEYDGEHHFIEMKEFRKNISLLDTQKKDKIKTDYCTNSNSRPRLIRISYKELKDIINILEKIFSH